MYEVIHHSAYGPKLIAAYPDEDEAIDMAKTVLTTQHHKADPKCMVCTVWLGGGVSAVVTDDHNGMTVHGTTWKHSRKAVPFGS